MENKLDNESKHSIDDIVAFYTFSNQTSLDFHTNLAFRSREMCNIHLLSIFVIVIKLKESILLLFVIANIIKF